MKIGFLVPSLSASQMSYSLIKTINSFYERKNTHNVDIVVFYENLATPCIKANFATSNVADAWGYTGNLFSTTLSTAYKILRFPLSRKFFYVYDIEWVDLKNKQYELLAEIYQSKALELVARSDSHYNVIKNAWNMCPVGTAKEFNINSFIELSEANA